MLERLVVGLGDRAYPIWIGHGILDRLGEALQAVEFPKKLAIVTNSAIADHYGELVQQALVDSGFAVSIIILPDGEEHKNFITLQKIFDQLIEQGFDRSSGLLALGGGVIGDMVGFAAAIFLRGIAFAQVPTTLLAQVDSSVGGKTAVNHPLGKNLIGAFYQPRHVHIDVATLATLPNREFAAGMAEVVKYGVICDREFFNVLSEQREALCQQDPEALIRVVKKSCQIKANVVEIDEKESSFRAILNFGHTFGHAVEALAGYGAYRHGEAVAIGMVVAAEISRRLDLCSQQDVSAIRELLISFGLPVDPPTYSVADYIQAMQRDKKVSEGILRLVLNRGIGDCLIQEVPGLDALLTDTLKAGISRG
ncbi:3-dehydroquinate synthase [Syntrophotalea acetylenivorans]|uniref:3-dehydroquinate synthase n=2 Tax=Syntrophotalea acetylenivorans TaxID=1842532 RepID=A0A1L3GT81_9BACT|nr:3-dehydroquinate synthase [Syntrophotalea acetylenivorans]